MTQPPPDDTIAKLKDSMHFILKMTVAIRETGKGYQRLFGVTQSIDQQSHFNRKQLALLHPGFLTPPISSNKITVEQYTPIHFTHYMIDGPLKASSDVEWSIEALGSNHNTDDGILNAKLAIVEQSMATVALFEHIVKTYSFVFNISTEAIEKAALPEIKRPWDDDASKQAVQSLDLVQTLALYKQLQSEIEAQINPVIRTLGLSDDDIQELRKRDLVFGPPQTGFTNIRKVDPEEWAAAANAQDTPALKVIISSHQSNAKQVHYPKPNPPTTLL